MSGKYPKIGTQIAVTAMLLDQVQKIYMLEVFKIAEKAPLAITDFFNLVMVWNRGISFGMFQGMQYSNYFFMAFTSMIILIIFILMRKATSRAEAIAFGLIIGGASGNLIDRILHSAVADFFDFYYKNYHWPAFNVADSCVFTGAALLMFATLFIKENKDEK